MELELLDFNDMKRMSRTDLLNAERNLDMMTRYGMSVREMENLNKEILFEGETNAAIEASGFTKEQIEAGISANIYSERGEKGNSKKFEGLDNITEWATNFRQAQESFYTLMELAMRDTPNRPHMEGYFHSITHDLYRARSHKDATVRRLKTMVSSNKARIFGVDTKELGKINKSHTEKQKASITINNRKSDILGQSKTGKDIYNEMTVNEAYKTWQATLMKNNDNAFFKMGWGVKEVDGKMVYDAELLRSELEAFIEKSSPVGSKVIDYARWQVEEFFPSYYPRLNEAHRQRNGIDMLYEVNFSPSIKIMEGENMQELSRSIMEGDAQFFAQSMLPGSMRAKKINPFVRINTEIDGDAFLARYIDKMEHFIHFQPVVDRMEGVFGDKNVRTALAINNGANMNKVIDGFIDRIKKDSTKKAETEIDKVFDFFKRKIVMSKLGLNISLFPKQLVALPAYMSSLDISEQGSFASKLIPTKDFIDTIKKLYHSDAVINRITSGGSERDFQDVISSLEKRADEYKIDEGKGLLSRAITGKLSSDMLIMTKLGDISTVLMGGQAIFRIKRDKYLAEGMSKAKAEQKAYEDFVISTNLTQASANIEDLSAIQAMGSVGKMMTLFQNTPLQYMRIEAAAVTNLFKSTKRLRELEKGSEARGIEVNRIKNSIKDVIIYHFMLPALFQAATKRFYIGEDEMLDDPDMLVSMGLGSGAYVFIAGQLLKAAADWVASGNTFGVQLSGITESVSKDINDSFKAIEKILAENPVTEKDIFDMIKTAKPIMSVIGDFTGAPLIPATNLIKGVYDYTTGKTDDIGSLIGYTSMATGEYDRSKDFRFMNEHLKNGDSLEKFLQDVRKQYPGDEFAANQGRLIREYTMYEHFGGYDPIVNHLYRSGLPTKDKAKYLLNLKEHKTGGVKTLSTIYEAKTMTDEKWNKLIDELTRFGVITMEVRSEIAKELYKKKSAK